MKEKTNENDTSILSSSIEIIGDEIKLHPVIAGVATFGLGFLIATLIFKNNK